MTAKRIFRAALISPVLLLWAGQVSHAEPLKEHIHIHHALHECKEARVELKDASHDFGGHREEALKAVDAAITQLDLCLTSAKDPFLKLTIDKDIYKEHKNHPHIRESIKELKEARVQLKEAKHDFGGHREQALKDVDFAIEQLEICLKHLK